MAHHLFGENLNKPNYPEVKIRQLGTSGNYVVIWGGELQIYSHTSGRIVATKKLTDSGLAFLETSSSLIVTGDNEKQLLLLTYDCQNEELKVKASYLMPRRISDVKLIDNDSRLLTADKFGDIHVRDWDEMERVSQKVYKFILRHITQFPKDATFSNLHKKYIEQMKSKGVIATTELDEDESSSVSKKQKANPLLGAEDTEGGDADDDDPFAAKCLANHLATVTKLHLMHLSTPKGQLDLLVSCDKDEKVRVSQCPDVHIIERIYCGHQSFVTDVTSIGTNIYTLATDKTMKRWELSQVDSEAQTWMLDAVPLKFVQGTNQASLSVTSPSATSLSATSLSATSPSATSLSDTSLSFIYCGSNSISTLDIATGNLSKLSLPETVVEACYIGPDTLLWVDEHGQLRLHTSGSSDRIISSFSTETKPLIHCHWKHTQADDAPSPDERRAKRLRHKHLLTTEETNVQAGQSVTS